MQHAWDPFSLMIINGASPFIHFWKWFSQLGDLTYFSILGAAVSRFQIFQTREKFKICVFLGSVD
jgi:hypothetical protein